MTTSIDLFRQTVVRDLNYRKPILILAQNVPLFDVIPRDEAARPLIKADHDTLDHALAATRLSEEGYQVRRQMVDAVTLEAMGRPFDRPISMDDSVWAAFRLANQVADGLNRMGDDVDLTDLWADWQVAFPNGSVDRLLALLGMEWTTDLLALYCHSREDAPYRRLLAALHRVIHVAALYDQSYIKAAFLTDTSDPDAANETDVDAPPDGPPDDDRDPDGRDPSDGNDDNIVRHHLFRSRIILPSDLFAAPVRPKRPVTKPGRGGRKLPTPPKTAKGKKTSGAAKRSDKPVYRKKGS